MVWRPDTTHTLVQTGDGLLSPLQLLTTGILQGHCLLQDILRLKIAHTKSLLMSVDIVALNHGMLVVPWRYADLNLRVLAGELGKGLSQERANHVDESACKSIAFQVCLHSQHAPRAATVVAVVEVHAFALENEGADAILALESALSASPIYLASYSIHTLAAATVRIPFTGIVVFAMSNVDAHAHT